MLSTDALVMLLLPAWPGAAAAAVAVATLVMVLKGDLGGEEPGIRYINIDIYFTSMPEKLSCKALGTHTVNSAQTAMKKGARIQVMINYCLQTLKYKNYQTFFKEIIVAITNRSICSKTPKFPTQWIFLPFLVLLLLPPSLFLTLFPLENIS